MFVIVDFAPNAVLGWDAFWIDDEVVDGYQKGKVKLHELIKTGKARLVKAN